MLWEGDLTLTPFSNDLDSKLGVQSSLDLSFDPFAILVGDVESIYYFVLVSNILCLLRYLGLLKDVSRARKSYETYFFFGFRFES